MSARNQRPIASALLATAIALWAVLALSHWAVCEQDDALCMFTGEASK